MVDGSTPCARLGCGHPAAAHRFGTSVTFCGRRGCDCHEFAPPASEPATCCACESAPAVDGLLTCIDCEVARVVCLVDVAGGTEAVAAELRRLGWDQPPLPPDGWVGELGRLQAQCILAAAKLESLAARLRAEVTK